jgi:hypothetical protein
LEGIYKIRAGGRCFAGTVKDKGIGVARESVPFSGFLVCQSIILRQIALDKNKSLL